MIQIGIDPGLTGAIAAIRGSDVILLEDAPVHRVGTKRVPDVVGMHCLVSQATGRLRGVGENVFAVIETQQAMPKQGVVGIFGLGRGYGLWEGMVAATLLPYELVRPQRWKKAMLDGLDKSSKASSRIAAGRLFPEADLGKRKDNGRADALLIAAFAQRVLCGEG